MKKILKLKCVKCGAEYLENEVEYVCPQCGIEGILDVIYDYELISKELTKDYLLNNEDKNITRYLPILPIESAEYFEPLQVGNTPLYEVKKIKKTFEIR
ncbi:hypothetical protein [Thermobrachium celere]|uniref:hypothetical protein n=1 Tax=Thermobrachium celere TaxID=53422 RepID=UPI0019434D33|nr:hypothetical protein [Thermobrachium celere]GFR36682.1 hypothetical protein TCEA9_24940 [Thermobrachium celere]